MFLAYECYRKVNGTEKKLQDKNMERLTKYYSEWVTGFIWRYNLWKTDEMEKLFAGEYSWQQRLSSKSLLSLSALPVKTAAKALQVVNMDAAKVPNFLS